MKITALMGAESNNQPTNIILSSTIILINYWRKNIIYVLRGHLRISYHVKKYFHWIFWKSNLLLVIDKKYFVSLKINIFPFLLVTKKYCLFIHPPSYLTWSQTIGAVAFHQPQTNSRTILLLNIMVHGRGVKKACLSKKNVAI